MKIEQYSNLKDHAKEVLLVPLFKASKAQAEKFKVIDTILDFKIAGELKRRSFEWQAGKTFSIDTPTSKQVKCVAFYCWDEISDEYKLINQYRALGAYAYKLANAVKAGVVSLDCFNIELTNITFAGAILEGFDLINYSFDKYKKAKSSKTIALRVLSKKKAFTSEVVKRAQVTCAATKLARDLVNLPPRDCTPRYLVGVAKQIAQKGRLKLEVLNEQALRKIGAGGLLGVSKGSSEPAFMIKLSYRPSKRAKKSVALVGKGVTFDSGGLSIKPADGMMTMKIDMAGAAAVLASMQAIAALKPNVAVKAYVPVTENMINGHAQKPGDVVRAVNGKTIEVLNTDAEGRLILADALSLAEREKPDAIIDLATLTGAVVVALGTEYAALYSTNDQLKNSLLAASLNAGERLWPLPLAEEYESLIKGTIADIRNIGAGRSAGSITAALFLKHFVGDCNWAHLDIAGTAYAEKDFDYIPKGGVGFGVRTLINYLLN